MNIRRILMSLAGVVLAAVSVASFKLAAFGVDPFQSFMSGIDALIPISYGTLYVLVNAALLLFALFFDRRYIGLATFINLFLLGYVAQFFHELFLRLLPDASIGVRIIFLLCGFLLMCFGSSLYITADLGVSTYDAIALIMAGTWKLGSFRCIRIATDVISIILGVALFLLSGGSFRAVGAIAGIGTVVTSLCVGPTIDFFNRKVSRPLLHR